MKRVNFKSLHIENFLSVGKTPVVISFKSGINVITGVNHDKEDSKNGVGKSTVADGLFFGLFGTTIRELKKDEIVNNVVGKKCKVVIELDVTENKDIDSYKITREISPTKLTLEKNGEDETKSSMPETTKEICNIIGATPDVFKNSVIMTVNGTIPFMAQKKVEKRKFCEGLFNIGVFEDMLLEARKRYNDHKNNAAIEETKITEIENTLGVYVKQKVKKDEYKEGRTKKLLYRKKNNITELEDLNSKIVDVDKNKFKEYEENIKLLLSKAESTNDDIRKIIKIIAAKEESIKTSKQIIKKFNEFGDMCDKCNRPFSVDDISNRNKSIELHNNEIKELENDINTQEESLKEFETLKEKCNKAIDKQKTNISDLKNTIKDNENVLSRIEQLNIWNKQIKIDIEGLESESNEFDTLIADTQTRLDTLTGTLKEITDKMDILDSVKGVVSEEGVKSFIIKKLLKLLNGKLAYYLGRLNAPCRFKFNEYFGEQIINEKGQECSYNNFSSGERKRIDLAILFTFMDIRRLQGNTSINLAFYDEILDTSLDDVGIKNFLEIVKERVEKYDEACYIISHKSTAIKSATNDIIFLEKKASFTTLGEYTEE